MKLVVQLAIIISIEYMKKFLFFLFLLLTLCNFAVGKISTESQRNLINTNIIKKDISCDRLLDLIGGAKSTNKLMLGNKNEEKNQSISLCRICIFLVNLLVWLFNIFGSFKHL